MASPNNASTFLELVKGRRSHYMLNKELPVSTDRIQEIVKEATLHVPSPWDCQPVRVIVLFGEHHDKCWDLITEVMQSVLPPDMWDGKGFGARFAGFKAAAATILFFEDQATVKEQQEKNPFVKDHLPGWVAQSDGMLQFALWTALEAEGLGANLQHLNPFVDERLGSAFDVPAGWQLNAQMVLGGRDPAGRPRDKTFLPLEGRYKVFGA
ncbi:Nitroreductase [Xylariaceae sp. FL0804]|nr:Nitroreductase [Xylariaceae sp. FL0804]